MISSDDRKNKTDASKDEKKVCKDSIQEGATRRKPIDPPTLIRTLISARICHVSRRN